MLACIIGGRSHIFRLAPVTTFLDPDPDPDFFKFENPTPVQNRATIDATEIQQRLYLTSDIYKGHAYSCCCRKYKDSASGTEKTQNLAGVDSGGSASVATSGLLHFIENGSFLDMNSSFLINVCANIQ